MREKKEIQGKECELKRIIPATQAIHKKEKKDKIISNIIREMESWAAKENLSLIYEKIEVLEDINKKGKGQKTLLHAAAATSLEIVVYLINKRADVNSSDIKGCTPLHYAKSIDIACILIANGANAAAKNRDKQTPNPISLLSYGDIVKETPKRKQLEKLYDIARSINFLEPDKVVDYIYEKCTFRWYKNELNQWLPGDGSFSLYLTVRTLDICFGNKLFNNFEQACEEKRKTPIQHRTFTDKITNPISIAEKVLRERIEENTTPSSSLSFKKYCEIAKEVFATQKKWCEISRLPDDGCVIF